MAETMSPSLHVSVMQSTTGWSGLASCPALLAVFNLLAYLLAGALAMHSGQC